MDTRPILTVAVPTYNGARHLAEALKSILAQEAAPFDLIVSDDRSEDETLAIVGRFAGDRARIEVNSERLGLAGNWNRCVVLSRTEWVAIFHQDDVMLPGHLAAHRAGDPGDPRIPRPALWRPLGPDRRAGRGDRRSGPARAGAHRRAVLPGSASR